jgi:HPt (histidine-containing phosphotransfer) domain-containing protein
VIDVGDMRNRLGDDDELIAEVIALFLEDCSLQIQAITSTLASRDLTAMQGAAHALKGSASNISARGVAGAARAVEAVASLDDAVAVGALVSTLVSETDRLATVLRGFQKRTATKAGDR